MKPQLIDINKKKEGSLLHDISLTPAERVVRMFDLIEFCVAFSKYPKIMLNKKGLHVVTLRKHSS